MIEPCLTANDYNLTLERLKKMSDKIGIAMLGQVFTNKDLIENVEKRTPEGKKWVLMQLEYMNYLINRQNRVANL